MIYFKIIQNKKIIDVGFSFLKWNQKHRQVYATSTETAQFVKGELSQKVYRDAWLKPVPSEAEFISFENANIEVINETEYGDLHAQLTSGEEINVNVDSPEVEIPREYIEETEEKPLSVSEMREIIKRQSDEIDRLKNCVIEMSEVVYSA